MIRFSLSVKKVLDEPPKCLAWGAVLLVDMPLSYLPAHVRQEEKCSVTTNGNPSR